MANDRTEKRHRRRRRGGFLDIVNALLTLVVIGILVAVGGFLYLANQFYAPGAVKADTTFQVDKGTSISTTAQLLEEKGLLPESQLIPSSLIFRAGTFAMKKQSALKAGVYLLKADYSMADILRELTEGKPLDFFVNVIPGETSYSVAQKLNEAGPNLTGEPVEVPPEGSLLAIRYDFMPGDARQSLIDKMQAEMKAKVQAIWEGRDRSIDDVIRSPEEMVTLASIVEKETGLASERPHVASVFINRLRKKMRLQSDPTIIYGLFGGAGKPADRPIYQSDIEKQTPYNTYIIRGLPPGPIANPGRAALEAVANPADTNDLYFVADGTGGHVFATTLEEHNRNVAKYRALMKQQQQQQGQGAAGSGQ